MALLSPTASHTSFLNTWTRGTCAHSSSKRQKLVKDPSIILYVGPGADWLHSGPLGNDSCWGPSQCFGEGNGPPEVVGPRAVPYCPYGQSALRRPIPTTISAYEQKTHRRTECFGEYLGPLIYLFNTRSLHSTFYILHSPPYSLRYSVYFYFLNVCMFLMTGCYVIKIQFFLVLYYVFSLS